MTLTRRSALGLIVLTAAGCRRNGSPSAVATAAPDAAALTSARTNELAILSVYDAAIASADGVAASRLSVERDFHAQHLAALRVTPTGTTAEGDIESLLRDSAKSLQAAALSAADGANAALFASIAASHRVMLGE